MKKLVQSDAFKNFTSSCIAILIGLVIGAIVIFISNSSEALNGFNTLVLGPIQDGMTGIGRVIYYAVPIIMTGLSVGFAFKTGLFNIGTPGQFIVGAFAAVYIGVKWTFLPESIHWVVALLGAFIAGGLWAVVPGVMKAYLNVNEVISSIMMNYIGIYFVNYSVTLTIFDSLRNQSLPVAEAANVPKMGLDVIFEGSQANGGFIIAILFVILIYIILNKTTFGYEMKACGFNKDASKYAGINEKRNIILSMVIAGALAGIGGGLLYLSGSGKFIEVVDVLPAEGFNGIPVALLGLSNPIGVLFSGLFIAYLTVGGNSMQQFGFIPQIVDIIISCIIYCSALSLMIKVWLSNRKTKKKEGE
ncbi:ABC transporter permease [Erysipelotrichaceae bacterium HCN-30851]